MLPEDRLESLLTLHITHESHEPMDTNGAEDEALMPLLDVARRLSDLGSAEPSPEFASRLERLILAQADSQQEYGSSVPPPLVYDATPLPLGDETPRLGNDYPTLPNGIWGTASTDATEAETAGTTVAGQPTNVATFQPIWRRALWAAIAAAILFSLSGATLVAAAAAGPGSPLYGLHRWEQDVQVTLAGDAASRTTLHMQYAQDALTALNTAAAQHQFGAPYDDALATYRDEMAAARASLADVPPGSQQNTLAGQLQQFQATGRSDLHAALAALPWQERVATTAVLASIGDHVPSVTHASMVYSGHGQHLWQITIAGSGFQQGALLLVNGAPAGNIVSVTGTTVVATLPGDDSGPLPATIGVANSDGTAAVTTLITSDEAQETPTASPQPSPTDDHGGDRNGGSGGSGSCSSSGPGPSTCSTPGDGGH